MAKLNVTLSEQDQALRNSIADQPERRGRRLSRAEELRPLAGRVHPARKGWHSSQTKDA